MTYDFSTFSTRMKGIQDWLAEEYTSIRTGRATPALLDGVKVSSYGAMTSLNQVGSVMPEDARTLRISVWDNSLVKAVEKALMDADLGVGVSSDSSGVRVTFPELSSDRREQLLKLAKAKLEDARVSVRSARDDEVKKFNAALSSDDEKHTAKESLQKHVDDTNKKLEGVFELKIKEISA